ncbi:MAG: Transcription factor WhiB [Ilumatobacteraceae bacterium]|nr:Transcription factor WhiB [Ilumatobacteraceae bacterium]
MATDPFHWMRPAWHADAACREHPEIDWFPTTVIDRAATVAICAACLVRDECLTAAIAGGEVGIWAGTTAMERHASTVALRATPGQRADLARTMAADGHTVDDIAARLDLSRGAAYKLLARNGIKLATARAA